jgi:hypothetical protein
LITALLWSDPNEHAPDADWEKNHDRGAGYLFGKKALERCLTDCDIIMIVRAHEVQEDGYKFHYDGRVVTIFSASYYGGKYENAAAMLEITAKSEGEVECRIEPFNMKSVTLFRSLTSAAKKAIGADYEITRDGADPSKMKKK